MATIKTGSVFICTDRDGKELRLRRIYTDAVGPDATVPDEAELTDAIAKAEAATRQDENFDGFQFEPWQEDS